MAFNKTTGTFTSTNGINQIRYYVYQPEGDIRGIMQISHGMCEYIERYEPHIEFFTSQGILVCGNDHLGHKGSVKSDDDLGYMGSKDGWKMMYQDVHQLTLIMKQEYPEVPYVLFGHSMGSFIARAVIGNYGKEYDGAIICGTGGTNKMIGMGLKMIHFIRKIKGERTRSNLLKKLSFGNYNSKYNKARTEYDWLTNNEAVVDTYMKDKYCMFDFTAAGYEDLLSVLNYVSQDSWYDSIPEELPLLLISGAMDPVGDWGNGIKEVDQRLKQRAHKEYSMKLYDNLRHEILNENEKERNEVYQDILSFLNKRF